MQSKTNYFLVIPILGMSEIRLIARIKLKIGIELLQKLTHPNMKLKTSTKLQERERERSEIHHQDYSLPSISTMSKTHTHTHMHDQAQEFNIHTQKTHTGGEDGVLKFSLSHQEKQQKQQMREKGSERAWRKFFEQP